MYLPITLQLFFVSFFSQEFEVTLTKGEKGLGFTVAGGQQTIGLFYVKDVLFDPALSSGSIQRGDRLMAVRHRTLPLLFPLHASVN